MQSYEDRVRRDVEQAASQQAAPPTDNINAALDMDDVSKLKRASKGLKRATRGIKKPKEKLI